MICFWVDSRSSSCSRNSSDEVVKLLQEVVREKAILLRLVCLLRATSPLFSLELVIFRATLELSLVASVA
jgi:hypothetical protein